jgi:hypothetical protein
MKSAVMVAPAFGSRSSETTSQPASLNARPMLPVPANSSSSRISLAYENLVTPHQKLASPLASVAACL